MEPQRSVLARGELKHEIFWKPIPVALHRTVQGFGGYAVQFRQITIEQDFLAANQENPSLDSFRRNHCAHLASLVITALALSSSTPS